MRVLRLATPALWLTVLGCPGPQAAVGTGGIAINNNGGTAADVLAFAVQPSNANAGEVITPAIQVTVRDSQGIPDSTFTGNVTIGIGTNPAGGNLSGTTSVAATNGVVLFGNLSIDRGGSGYTLTAAAPGMNSVTSASFNITTPTPSATR